MVAEEKQGAAGRMFSEEERKAVEAAVERAEGGTSAEIIPVVAAASARHRRGEDLAGLWLAFLGLLGLAIFSPGHQIDGIEALIAFVLGIAAGSFTAEKVPAIKRLFIPRSDLDGAAADGAARAFRTYGAGETEGRTGLLIYVSLFERSAVVLGDVAVGRALAPEDYGRIRDILVAGLKSGKVEKALVEAIDGAGAILAAKLPRKPDDRPEIPNVLRILD
jgi:putative membrane protein